MKFGREQIEHLKGSRWVQMVNKWLGDEYWRIYEYAHSIIRAYAREPEYKAFPFNIQYQVVLSQASPKKWNLNSDWRVGRVIAVEDNGPIVLIREKSGYN